MNLAKVIEWKHPNIKAVIKDVNGVQTITEFEGGVPSQANQDLWLQEYNAYISSEQYLDDKATAEFNTNDILKIIINAFLNHENRVRTLESRPPITKQQLISALRKL